MITLKQILPVILVLALVVGILPVASATSSLSIGSISYSSPVVKAESFTVSSSITASNVAGTITVTVTLIDNTGGAVTITEAEKTLTFNTNATQNVQWSVTAGTAGTYSNPFTITATASDSGTATPKTSDTPLTIQERPVLEVTFSGDKTSVSAGDSVRLDFTIMNSAAAGAADATNVIATLTLPNGWTRVTGPSPYTLGTIASGGGSKSGYWIVSADSPSSSNTITITVTSTLPGGTITKTVAITGPTPSTPPGLLGGGGGGGEASILSSNIPVDPVTGAVKSTTTLSIEGATLTIPEGTIVKDAEGKPLSTITMQYTATIAESVGAFSAYDYGPRGATFVPPIDLVIAYDPADLPEGFRESDLVIRMWDGTAWIDLVTTIDTATHTATAKVSHFTIFALFAVPPGAPAPVSTPTPVPTPTPLPITPTPPGALPLKLPWGLIIGIIVAVISIGAATLFFYTKKKVE